MSACCEDKDLTSSSVTEITYRITVYVELHIHQVFIQPYAPELYIKPSSKKEYPRLCFIVIKKKKKSRPQQYCKLEEGTFPPPPQTPKPKPDNLCTTTTHTSNCCTA